MDTIKLNGQFKPNHRYRQNNNQEPPQPTPTELRFLKALHWMRCPKCGLPLTTRQYGALELDLCRRCRGAWLDAPALQALLAPASHNSGHPNHHRQ